MKASAATAAPQQAKPPVFEIAALRNKAGKHSVEVEGSNGEMLRFALADLVRVSHRMRWRRKSEVRWVRSLYLNLLTRQVH